MLVTNNMHPGVMSFKGTTAIRAVTDSHQEARREAALLSKVASDAKDKDNILLLNCGDLFCGVYNRDLMVDNYLRFKKHASNVEVVMTIGNNDPFSIKDKYIKTDAARQSESSVDFLKNAIRKFEDNGIHVVCANLTDKKTGDYPDWIKPYQIVERDGDRIFVTGFCIDRLTPSLGVNVIDQVSAFEKLKSAIEEEQPDSIIVLNHDYYDTSKSLMDWAKKQGIKIDLIIEGHDHNNIPSDVENNIYCPKCFSLSMLEMDLQIKNKKNKILNRKEVLSKDASVNPELSKLLDAYEKESGMLKAVAPSILNLPKSYENPCGLGTFISDEMCRETGAEAAFFASNAIKIPLLYHKDSNVSNYDLRKVITFDSTIQTADLSVDELKEALTSAVKYRLKLGAQNSRFLQCSSNIRIVGKGNSKNKTYQIEQIYLNDEPLLNEEGKAADPERKIKCAFDNFIPTDGRSIALQNARKQDVIVDGKKLRLDEVLKRALKDAAGKYEPGTEYAAFKLEENIV